MSFPSYSELEPRSNTPLRLDTSPHYDRYLRKCVVEFRRSNWHGWNRVPIFILRLGHMYTALSSENSDRVCDSMKPYSVANNILKSYCNLSFSEHWNCQI